MFTPIDRYDEFNAATLNARFAQLEANLLALRDPSEVIVNTTLATATETISINLGATAWAMLHLTAALTLNGVRPMLRANEDVVGNYSWGIIYGNSSNWGGLSGSPSPNPTGIFLDGNNASTITTLTLDLWMTVLPTASTYQFAVLGEGTTISGATESTFHVGGHYKYLPTVLHLTFSSLGSGYLYSVGSRYRLEGIRA